MKNLPGLILSAFLLCLLVSCFEDEVNTPPIISNQNFSVPENESLGFVIGIVQASDKDGDAINLSILSGNDGATFSMNSSTGELVLTGKLDHSTKSLYTLTVQASDGQANATAVVTIEVEEVNGPPIIENQTFEVSETVGVGTAIGTVIATDEEGDDIEFLIADGNTNSTFSIDDSTGELALEEPLNFAEVSTFSLLIEVDDGNSSATATVTVNVTEVAESIWDLISEDESLSQFRDEIMRFSELEALLGADGDITIFAPTNNALTAILDNLGITGFETVTDDIAEAVLSYHIVTQIINSSDISEGMMVSTLQGESFEFGSGPSIISGATATATFVTTDIPASNGVIHIIDAVLVPPTIGDVVVSTLGTLAYPIYFGRDFTTLLEGIFKADAGKNETETIFYALATTTDLTFFAPTNETFAAAAITAESLTAAEWDAIIRHHLVVGQGDNSNDNTLTLDPEDLVTGASFTTIQGQSLLFFNDTNVISPVNGVGIFIDSNGDVDLTDPTTYTSLDAEVVLADAVVESNGRIHVIAGILAPAQ